MDNLEIIILDDDIDRANQLIKLFEEKNIASTIFDDTDQNINTLDLKIVLATQQFLSTLSRDDIKVLFRQADKKNIIVYGVSNDASRRLAFYKLGAFRVFDKSYQVRELAIYTANVLNKFDKQIDEEPSFRGSLSDFSLPDLIYSFGRDKISGILRVFTPYCSGKIIFNNGDIDDASCGYHYGDEAVLFMLTWIEGFFALSRMPIKINKHKVHLSNIGLLLQGERTRADVNEIIHKFGHPGISVKIVNKGDLVSQLINSKYEELVEKLDQFTILQEFLAFSSVNVSELSAWLYQLREDNFLEVRDDSGIDIESLSVVDEKKSSGLGEKLLGSKEVAYLREILHAEEISTGKLLVLGTNSMTNTDFIHVFNQGSLTPVRKSHDLDFTRIELDDNFSLNVFGISLSKEVNDTIEKLSAGLLGYIVLIDNQKPEHFEYASYVLNNLSKLYSVPWTAALTNLDDNQQMSAHVKASLKIPGDREIIPLDVSQKEDVKNIILSIH